MRVIARIVALVGAMGVLATCGSSSPSPVASGIVTTTTTVLRPVTSLRDPGTTVTVPVASTVAPPPSADSSTTAIVSTSTTAPAEPRTTSTTAAPSLPSSPDRALDAVGTAGQAILVTASSYGATTATLTAYQRGADGWQVAFGPWTAHVGYNGLAPPGEKTEGDGRTPSGVYGFGFFFGVQPDPGVRFPYRQVTSRSIVWDDDPSSPLYNEWVDSSQQDPGADPEAMYQPGAYAYGAVIAYNTARTPGLGSAIFLHVSTGGATAGCVSLPSDQLLEVLRWLDPAQAPRIVLGVG